MWGAGRGRTRGCIRVAIRLTYFSPNRTPSPPPMITASGSSRFTAEAIPAPRAFTARSISRVARSSPCLRARSQTPLVSRSRPRSSMIRKRSVFAPRSTSFRALISIARRPAYASMQPFRPQVHRAPPRFTTMPDLAGGPTSDPELAVEDQPRPDPGAPPDPEDRVEPLPAPSSNSPWTATSTSLPIRTGTPNWSERCSPRGKAPSQPGRFLAPDTTPVLSSASPGEPIPTPARSRVPRLACAAASRARRRFRARRPRARPCRAWAVATRRELCCSDRRRRSGSLSRRGRFPRGACSESGLTSEKIRRPATLRTCGRGVARPMAHLVGEAALV